MTRFAMLARANRQVRANLRGQHNAICHVADPRGSMIVNAAAARPVRFLAGTMPARVAAALFTARTRTGPGLRPGVNLPGIHH
jgi:hypothetical protein